MPPPARRRRHSAIVVIVATLLLLLMLSLAPQLARAQQAAGASWSTEALPATSSSLTSSAVAAAAAGVPLAKPDYTVYKTRERVFDQIESMVAANPSTMRLDTVEAPPAPKRGGSDEKSAFYSPTMRVVTVEPGGLSPGPPGSAAERESHADKYRLLLNYGEHGRELVTVESALALLRDLADPSLSRAAAAADADPVRSSLGGSERLRALLKRTVFKIVPMENEAGRGLVERGELCERKNGRGVDPNRNWGVDWGKKESDYDPSEEFPGDAPFSEPEARILASLAASFAPHAWINVHSGMEAVFSPYDHVAATPKGAAADATAALLAAVDAAACGGRCAKGSGGAAVGYLAHGTATDYMYDVLKVPVASTWEIYGDEEAGFEDCFKMFNPTVATESENEDSSSSSSSSSNSKNSNSNSNSNSKHSKKRKMPSLEKVASAWADGALVVLENLPGHPGVKLGPEARDAQANAARAASSQFDGRFAVRDKKEEREGLVKSSSDVASTANVSRSTKASSSSSLPRPMGGHAVSASSSSSSSNSPSIHWLSAGVVALAAGAFVVRRRQQSQSSQLLQQRRREGAIAAASSAVGVSSVRGVISVGGERGALGLLSKPQRQE